MTDDQDRAAFEAWARKHHANGAYFTPQMDLSRVLPSSFAVWQAATTTERERAAQVCVETAKAFGANEDHAIAFGAYRCADKIRSGE